MEWTESISKAIHYIEENIMEDITMEDIALQAMISPFYFQNRMIIITAKSGFLSVRNNCCAIEPFLLFFRKK